MYDGSMWKTIPDWPCYEAHTDGRIRRNGGMKRPNCRNELSPVIRPNGYAVVNLYAEDGRVKQVQVHRLVLAAHVGPLPAGHEVNHRNGRRADNRLVNLEYVTRSENQRHALRTGLARVRHGEETSGCRLTSSQITEMRRLRADGWRQKALAQRFGCSQSNVSLICAGKSRAHDGHL